MHAERCNSKGPPKGYDCTPISQAVSSPTLLTLIGPLTSLSATVTSSPFCKISQPPPSLSSYTSLLTSGIASRHDPKPRLLSSCRESARATSDGQNVLGGCLVVRKCSRWLCRGEAALEGILDFGKWSLLDRFQKRLNTTPAFSLTTHQYIVVCTSSYAEHCPRSLPGRPPPRFPQRRR